MVDKSTFDATRDALIKFEVEPFVAMIDQIKSDGKCSGDFDDAKWPRNERLVSGQKHLVEIGLPSLDKLQKQCRASALSARVPVDPLLAFLKRREQWKVEQLKPEATRRGISLIDPETKRLRNRESLIACIHADALATKVMTKVYPSGYLPQEVQPHLA